MIDASASPLMLFNSLTRSLETFEPVHPGVPGDPANPPEARVYSCGPTVYNFQHIGNMRAYVFADTLGRTLKFKDYKLRHIINITDVGHLTSDADVGDDKMEKAAAQQGKTAWDVAAFYTAEFKRDLNWLNVRDPAKWTVATDYVARMIEFAKRIADTHCYELDSGLYFDVSTVADYGRLARAVTDDGEGRIDEVEGKRHAADFAIWRKTPVGETRQMEWDSPWGRGAPGWHLECSVMGEAELGMPFDIHTGGIDHREIHHPNEIAQNQAYRGCGGLDCAEHSGARMWMHNNFLIDRGGKMSKSTGEFLRLQLLVDRGYHPLAYRLMCLQAHYRSELEFSWEGLGAAFTRLKRMYKTVEKRKSEQFELTGTPVDDPALFEPIPRDKWHETEILGYLQDFDVAMSDDLNTPKALLTLDTVLQDPSIDNGLRWHIVATLDQVLGLDILRRSQKSLRVRPKAATITVEEIDMLIRRRKDARDAKDFAASDKLRDTLTAAGVEVMDGDPLGWDWRLEG
ncbi:Cysteine-tRNA ligase [Sphingopyxis fribergensis]|uniref:Cysteine--tRNA ligase n=1 Tax=Sphingopyxis fribergensis TaxID=1515612 RepID=A0A0A7PCG8_9SPHN|nr:cysteine--tRNA ligase [Sphingopyxis fribergensis]AJA07811.1 Cysteine-tRNA ligase [Sphingopyxis fribergensis]